MITTSTPSIRNHRYFNTLKFRLKLAPNDIFKFCFSFLVLHPPSLIRVLAVYSLHRKTRLHEELGGSVVDFLFEIEGLRV